MLNIATRMFSHEGSHGRSPHTPTSSGRTENNDLLQGWAGGERGLGRRRSARVVRGGGGGDKGGGGEERQG